MGFIKNIFSGPPKPPSPERVAEVSGKAAKEIAEFNAALNRVNQQTPFGELIYTQTGTDASGAPLYTARTQLSPEQQAILDNLQGNQQFIGGITSDLLGDTADMYSEAPNFNALVSDRTGEFLGRHLAYTQPYYTQALENRENELINRGVLPGTPAFEREMRELRQSQDQSVGMFINQAQPLLFNQAVTQFNTPLDVISRFMGLARPAGLDLITPATATASTPDITKAFKEYYDAQLGQYNQGWNQLMSAVGMVAGLPTGVGSATIGGTLGANAGGSLSKFMGLV